MDCLKANFSFFPPPELGVAAYLYELPLASHDNGFNGNDHNSLINRE
jgi:hypothetical protein